MPLSAQPCCLPVIDVAAISHATLPFYKRQRRAAAVQRFRAAASQQLLSAMRARYERLPLLQMMLTLRAHCFTLMLPTLRYASAATPLCFACARACRYYASFTSHIRAMSLSTVVLSGYDAMLAAAAAILSARYARRML